MAGGWAPALPQVQHQPESKGYRPRGTNEIKRNDYCMTHCWRAVNISGGRVSSYVRVSECGWFVSVLHSGQNPRAIREEEATSGRKTACRQVCGALC